MGVDGRRHLGVTDVVCGQIGAQCDHRSFEVITRSELLQTKQELSGEIGKAIEAELLGQTVRPDRRNIGAVPGGQQSNGGRAHRTFEVDVQFDFGEFDDPRRDYRSVNGRIHDVELAPPRTRSTRSSTKVFDRGWRTSSRR
jgi:hypothetical protein